MKMIPRYKRMRLCLSLQKRVLHSGGNLRNYLTDKNKHLIMFLNKMTENSHNITNYFINIYLIFIFNIYSLKHNNLLYLLLR